MSGEFSVKPELCGSSGMGNGLPRARHARNAALMTLAAELPAPVLAILLDLHIATAVAWTNQATIDWVLYLAARDLGQR